MAKSTNARRQDPSADSDQHGRNDRTRDIEEGINGANGSRARHPDTAANSGPRRLSGIRAAAAAQEQLEMLIQRPVESVSGLFRHGEGWVVTLEVVELERIPPTTDILATYRVELDENGELMSYDRAARYYRNQAGGES
jgi:hypothetical protein